MDTLELEQVFSIAIRREVEAHEFYRKIAERTTDISVQTVFRQLAKDELGHMELLEGFKLDPTMPLKIAPPKADFKVAESAEAPDLSIDMKPADAIALAMKKEQGAVEFYKALAGNAKDAATRDIFLNLMNMEMNHKHALETVYVEIGYPESF